MSCRSISWVCLLWLLVAVPALSESSMEDRYKAADQYGEYYGRDCVSGEIVPVWLNDSSRFWYLSQERDGERFMVVDPAHAVVKPAFDQEDLAGKLSRETGRDCRPTHLPFRHIDWSEGRVAFAFDGKRYEYDCTAKELTPAAESKEQKGVARDAGISPNGAFRPFIKDHNLYLKELESGREIRLGGDGTANEPYVLPVWWAPDSSQLVCNRMTVVKTRHLTVIESSPEGSYEPKSLNVAYPKPGDELSVKRPVLCGVTEDSARPVSFPEPEKQYSLGNIRWAKDGGYFTFHYNKRGPGAYTVYRVDKDDPVAKPVVCETSPTFIHYGRLFCHELDGTREILWISERDGWRHLYVFDSRSGQILRQLTQGEWIVKRVLNVDEVSREILFIGCGQTAGEDPYLEKLYRVSIDGGPAVCLTPENAHHSVYLSPDRKFFVDAMSRVDLPAVSVLRETGKGDVVMKLKESDMASALERGWKAPEVFCAKGRDGVTDIWGIIMRPADFKPGRRYPVIEHIYAGPHDSFVPKKFAISQSGVQLTELGFIVVQIDGMGTANRSKKFHDVCWKNLKDSGFPDRIAWMKQAAAKYPEMDIGRVGIYGCSAGGQSAMAALLFHPEFYKAGVSSCGCHDNRVDKIWWNEQWMGYPVGDHYADNSNVTHASKLQGHLMLILGEIDTNVDPASTRQVVDALIKAGKDFDYVLLPGEGHTLGGRYGERKRRDFFIKHLMGIEPPDRNALVEGKSSPEGEKLVEGTPVSPGRRP